MKHQLLSTAAVLGSLALLGAWAAPQPVAAGFVINSLPAIVDQSGTWCVTGNLTAGPGEIGIQVTVPDVIIDLGGHTLTGDGSSESESGVQGFVSNVQVRNGTLNNWGGYGILLATRARVENVRVTNCTIGGIGALKHATIRDCQFEGNVGGDVSTPGFANLYNLHASGNEDATSIDIGTGGIVEKCFVEGAGVGIDAGIRCRVVNCSVESFKETGIKVRSHSSVLDCTASSSGLDALLGIETGENSRVDGCQVSGQVEVGIHVAENSSVRDSIVDSSTRVGILAETGSRVTDCTATRCNATATIPSAGIEGRGDVRVSGCMLRDNISSGLRFSGEGGEAVGCTSIGNGAYGFSVGDEAIVLDCLAKDNVAAGIFVTGNRGRFQRNTTDGNNQGLVVHGVLNLITDNRASQNLNEDFTVPWGNPYGKVLAVIGQLVGSIPHANFASN